MLANITRNAICLALIVLTQVSVADAQSPVGKLRQQQTAAQPSTNQLAHQIIGDWYTESVLEDGAISGIGHRFEANGQTMLVLKDITANGDESIHRVNGTYFIKGNQVSITFNDGNTDNFTCSVENDSLIIHTAEGPFPMLRIHREQPVAPATHSDPTGVWGIETAYSDQDFIKTVLMFDVDGGAAIATAVFENGQRVEFDEILGTYYIEGNRVVISWSNKTVEEATFAVQGDQLSIEFDGTTYQFFALER